MKKYLILPALFFCLLLIAEAQTPVSPLTASYPDYLKHKEETMFNLEWIGLGPVVNSARVDAIQIDPSDPSTMYVAFSSGSLWKSINNGLSWKPVFENKATNGIGDFAVSKSNPNVIYLGTGDNLKKPRNFTIPGDGIYRSDDGGESWKYLGLNDSWTIGEIKIHPTNPDIVFVAALGHLWSTNKTRGIFRSINGGETWEHVLFIDEKTGGNDIVISESDPNIIYATMWEMYPDISGPGSSVHKSTDGGKTWNKLGGGLPDGPKNGRMGVAVSFSNPDKAYVLADNLNKDKNLAAEVYLTIDGGKSWTRTHKEELMIFPGIGWYFTDIYVNPRDDDEIYAMGVRIAHSSNGGESFDLVGGDIYHIFPSTADFFHLDFTELWIDPANPNHLAAGNDGGFFVSYDRGATWMHYNNIPAGEFYDITTGPGTDYLVYGGAQDDATVYGPADEWDPRFPDNWKYVWLDAWGGGDGCVSQVDPIETNIVYFSSQNGGVRRKDMLTGRSVGIRPSLPEKAAGELNFNFIAPYFISPHNRLTLYHGGNYVFRSTNRGDNWKVISGDLSVSAVPEKRSVATGAIAESPIKAGVIYAGTDRGAFWTSLDDGASWKEYSAGLPNNYIRSICPSKYSLSRVYVTLTGINYDDLNLYVYVSENYGASWKPLNANLPNEIANVIAEDPVNENILYLGTIRGVYVSLDRGEKWSLLGAGLPSVPVSDIEIQKDAMDIVIATYGRGIYKMNLKPLHESVSRGKIRSNNFLLPPPVVTQPWINDTHRDPDYRSVEKAPFSFVLKKSGEVILKITDKEKKVIWEKRIAAHAGINQYRWDLVLGQTESPLPYFFNYYRYITPGNYKLLLEVDREITEQDLVVKRAIK